MAKDYKYTDATPVDEPVSPPPKQAASAPKKMAKGGSASSRADGCAKTGKTRGTMISMCGGGKAKK